jgi:hypothetical protein
MQWRQAMKESSRTAIIVAGVIGGALLGGVFAWLSSARAEEEGDETAIEAIGPAEYFQLGIGILTLARQFQSILRRQA